MPMRCNCRKTCFDVGCRGPPSVRRRFPPTRRACELPCQRHLASTMSLNWSRPCMRSTRPVLVLVHGWGMNARVFDVLAQLLAGDFDVRALDLPGHGGRSGQSNNSLQDWADDLAEQVPEGSTVLGWSLGGQVVLRAAACRSSGHAVALSQLADTWRVRSKITVAAAAPALLGPAAGARRGLVGWIDDSARNRLASADAA